MTLRLPLPLSPALPLALALAAAAAACTDFDDLPRGVCGNGLVEPGEDCDATAADCVRCAAACAAASDCPNADYTCGVDGFCHAPGGALDRPSAPVRFQVDDLRVADLDHDGTGDVLGVSKTSVVVRYGDAAGALAASDSFVTPAQSGPPSFGDLDGDGSLDLTLATLDGIVSFASRYGTLAPLAIESPIYGQDGHPLDFARLFAVGPQQLGAFFLDDHDLVVLAVVDFLQPNRPFFAAPCAARLGAISRARFAQPSVDIYQASAPGALVAQYVVSFVTGAGEACVMAIHGTPGAGYALDDVTPAGAAPLQQAPRLADLDADGDPCPSLVSSDNGAQLRRWDGAMQGGRCVLSPGGPAGIALPPTPGAPASAVVIGRVPLVPPILGVASDALVMSSGVYVVGGGAMTAVYASSRRLGHVAHGDLDGDGDVDVILGSADEDDLDLLYRYPLGVEVLRIDTASRATSITIGDFDGNTVNDIAYTETAIGHQDLLIAYGTSDRPLPPAPVASFSDVASVASIRFGDSVDTLDLADDLVVIQPGAAGELATLSLLHGSPQRTMLSFFDPRPGGLASQVVLRGAVVGRFAAGPEPDLLALATRAGGRRARVDGRRHRARARQRAEQRRPGARPRRLRARHRHRRVRPGRGVPRVAGRRGPRRGDRGRPAGGRRRPGRARARSVGVVGVAGHAGGAAARRRAAGGRGAALAARRGRRRRRRAGAGRRVRDPARRGRPRGQRPRVRGRRRRRAGALRRSAAGGAGGGARRDRVHRRRARPALRARHRDRAVARRRRHRAVPRSRRGGEPVPGLVRRRRPARRAARAGRGAARDPHRRRDRRRRRRRGRPAGRRRRPVAPRVPAVHVARRRGLPRRHRAGRARGRCAVRAAALAALALAAAALVLAPAPARADDAPAGDAPATRAAAERYFRAGARAYAAQSFAAAAANFDEAYRALPLPEIAFSAAQAYRRLYRVEPKPAHVQRAVELYRVYLDQVKTGGRVGDAADSLQDLERELDKLKARGARIDTTAVERTRIGIDVSLGDRARDAGALREIGDATGAALEGVTLTIDGKPVEPFALIDVAPGEHAIAVSAAGYFPVEKRQHAVRGASAIVELELRPRPAKVTVRTEPGAKLAIDGRGVPSPQLELAAGKHLLTITRRGRAPYGRELAVERGQELAVTARLAKTGRRRAVPWVLGGAGVLAAGATLSAISALVEDGRAEDLRAAIRLGNRPASAGDDFDGAVARRDTARTAAWVLGAGALAAGATAAALYFLDTPSAEGLRIAPTASPSGGGLTALGRF